MRTKLQPDEKLILVVKQHWVVLIKPLIVVLVAFVAYPELLKRSLLGFNSILGSLTLYVEGAAVLYFLYHVYERRVNIWAVTDVRLIDEWGVITHHAKESPLEKINNVDILQTVIGRLFHYGSVSIQTAATSGETWIRYVAKPLVLQETIMRMVRLHKDRKIDHQAIVYEEGLDRKKGGMYKCPQCGTVFHDSALEYLRVSVAVPRDVNPTCHAQKSVRCESGDATAALAQDAGSPEEARRVDKLITRKDEPLSDPNDWKGR